MTTLTRAAPPSILSTRATSARSRSLRCRQRRVDPHDWNDGGCPSKQAYAASR